MRLVELQEFVASKLGMEDVDALQEAAAKGVVVWLYACVCNCCFCGTRVTFCFFCAISAVVVWSNTVLCALCVCVLCVCFVCVCVCALCFVCVYFVCALYVCVCVCVVWLPLMGGGRSLWHSRQCAARAAAAG